MDSNGPFGPFPRSESRSTVRVMTEPLELEPLDSGWTQATWRLGLAQTPLLRLDAIMTLRLYLDELELDAVRVARAQAIPWSEIGRALRVSTQAAHHRFRDLDPDLDATERRAPPS
jgi:hypothetical protein